MKERVSLFLAMMMLLACIPSISLAEAVDREGITEETISKEMPSDKEAIDALPAEEHEVESTEESTFGNLEVGEIDGLEEPLGATAQGFENLKTAATTESELEVSGDYAFTEPIVIENKMLTIRNTAPAIFQRADGYHGRFFEVKEGGQLTILSEDGQLIFDGEGADASKGYTPGANSQSIPGSKNNKMNGAFIDVANGELTIGNQVNGPKFINDKNIDSGMYVAALAASGPEGKIIFNAGEVSGMKYGSYKNRQTSYSAGAFTIGDGAQLELNGGEFKGNEIEVKNFDDLSYPNDKVRNSLAPFNYKTMVHEGSAGVARLDVGAKMIMNGGVMQGNISDAGAIWVGAYEPRIDHVNDETIDTWPAKANAKFTMNGGTIDSNWGITNKSAGGIVGMFHADIIINDGTLSNNKGEVGGVLVWDRYRYERSISLDRKGYSDWQNKFKVSLEVNGGEFIGNQALQFGDYLNFIPALGYKEFSKGEGGAIYIGTKDAMIGLRGKNQVIIKDNYAQDWGGGIYVSKTPYTLNMGGTYITENEATMSYGGLYQDNYAPGVRIFPEKGATITKNKIGEGQFSNGIDIGKVTTADLQILPNYTKLGSKIDYYTYDWSIDNRHLVDSSKPVIFGEWILAYTEANVRDENALQLEDTYSRVLIKGNKSQNAGGIAVYGYLNVGNNPQGMIMEDGKPVMDYKTLSATSAINWGGLKEDFRTQKIKDEEVNISLYRTQDGVEYLVDDLIRANKTTHLTMLPKNIYGTDVRENTKLKSEVLENLGFQLTADLYERDAEEPVKVYEYEYFGPRKLSAENYKFKIHVLPPDFAPESWYEDSGPTVEGKTYHKLTIDPMGGELTKGEKCYWVAEDFEFKTEDLPVEIQKDGKHPIGYSYERDGKLIHENELIKLGADTTIYAVWGVSEPNIIPGSESKDNPDAAKYHKLELDPNGGLLTGEKYYWIKDGYGVKLEDLSGTKVQRKGFKFDNWMLDDQVVSYPLGVTSDVTLKAKWEKIGTDGGGTHPRPPIIGPIIPEKPGENLQKIFVKGYIEGYPDHTVRPDEKISRVEAAAMFARAYELDLSDTAKPNFPDTEDAWYNPYVNAVVKKGIMEGYPDGSFKPNDEITRAEFVKMIEVLDRENEAVAPFRDIKSHWAEDFINQAYGNKRIDGYPDGSFKPDRSITRAEAVKVLNEMTGRRVKSLDEIVEPMRYIDLSKDHWAYLEILLASDHWIWK